MPVYEFKCLDCGNTFTLPLSVRDFEHKEYECPSCKKKNLEEQFTSVSVVTSKKS
jgi:putative FmdB family regulatory protein